MDTVWNKGGGSNAVKEEYKKEKEDINDDEWKRLTENKRDTNSFRTKYIIC